MPEITASLPDLVFLIPLEAAAALSTIRDISFDDRYISAKLAQNNYEA